MKTIRDLIEKYEKENVDILKKRPDLDITGDFTMEGTVYFRNEVFIQDLKEYEKSIYQLPTDLNKCVKISTPENYPPLRERLICAIATGLMASNPIDLHGNCNLPVSRDYAMNVVSYADAIIKQLNQ